MTLDEAIEHAYDVVKETDCRQCAMDHIDLAEWLEELKERRLSDAPNYNHKYNAPDYKHITCKVFSKIDGMNGSCHYCIEDTPYQWEMCSDESWKRNLMSIHSKCHCTEEEAIEFINNYKSKIQNT